MSHSPNQMGRAALIDVVDAAQMRKLTLRPIYNCDEISNAYINRIQSEVACQRDT